MLKRPRSSQGEGGAFGDSSRIGRMSPGLCQHCSTIAVPELRRVFSSSQVGTNRKKARFKVGKIVNAIRSEDNCSLCKFFVETLQLRTRDNSFRILDVNINADIVLRTDPTPWFTEAGISINKDCCLFAWLEIGNQHGEPFICISLEPKAHPVGEPHPSTDQVFPMQRFALEAFNGSCYPGIILSWLEKCKLKHNSCHEEQISLPSNFMVIDVRLRRLARLPAGHRFLTLSYVWGKGGLQQRSWLEASPGDPQSHRRYCEGLLLPDNLPQTIEDAICITRQLKEQYLWVDMFCIDQTDTVGKQAQIEAMDAIFASSHLTLVCVDGVDADYGLTGASRYMSQTKQPKVSTPIGRLMATHIHSQWSHNGTSAHDQRAWTLQERLLSRRCLYFSDTYFSMLCQQDLFHDLLDINILCPEVIPWLGSDYFREDGSDIDLDRTDWSFDTYGNLVSVYTMRNITDEEDAYNACRGSLRRMTVKCGMEFHFALPKDDLMQALLWVPHHENILLRRRGFASWSWLGWKGRSEYPYWIHHKNTEDRPCEPLEVEHRSMSRNTKRFQDKNAILEAAMFSDKTMTAPVIQLRTTVRTCRVELYCQSGQPFRPSPMQEVQIAIGDQWAIVKTDNSKLSNPIGENQYFEPSLVSFRLHGDQSSETTNRHQQIDLVFIKYWTYIWDRKRNEKHLVSALVTVRDKEGSYQRLSCVTLSADEWLAGDLKEEIVTLV